MIIKLNEITDIDKAIDLAMDVHSGQIRKKSKQAYFLHPFRVYQSAKQNNLSKSDQIVALLHDVYEDGKNKKYIIDKIKELFGTTILKAVILLSHDNGVDYNSYLLLLAKQNPILMNIKMLDMIENMKDNPSNKQKHKYITGILYLLKNNIKLNTKLINKIKMLAK